MLRDEMLKILLQHNLPKAAVSNRSMRAVFRPFSARPGKSEPTFPKDMLPRPAYAEIAHSCRHRPPRADRMPRSFSARVIASRVVAPVLRIASTTGIKPATNSSSRARLSTHGISGVAFQIAAFGATVGGDPKSPLVLHLQ